MLREDGPRFLRVRHWLGHIFRPWHVLNDADVMVQESMLFLLDIVTDNSLFDDSLVFELNHSAINQSLLLGIGFILNTQIIVADEPTIWSQQYDMNDLSPSGARSFELTGRSTWESAGVTALLLNWPDREIAVERAIVGAIKWYESNAIWNMTYVYGLPNQEGNGEILAQRDEVMWHRLDNHLQMIQFCLVFKRWRENL